MIARFAVWVGAMLLTGCATLPSSESAVRLSVAGLPIPAEASGMAVLYRVPGTAGFAGPADQQWSALGREDRGSVIEPGEYRAVTCARAMPGAMGRDDVIAAIAERATDHRIIIINESHSVTRHRDTIRRLLAALRPLGYSVYAAETFNNSKLGPDPVETTTDLPFPHIMDGFYTFEPVFGRAVREAKRLGFRLAAYEQTTEQEAPEGADIDVQIEARETAQASNLAAILSGMGPDEKLVVHVGYSHASEVPVAPNDRLWMAARLKALTGIDPLTVSQTLCRSEDGEPFLAQLPTDEPAGLVDLVLSQPVTQFARNRPMWRRESGDVEVELPPQLRYRSGPLIIEAFRTGEPFQAIPMDRIYLEPDENIPLLLPPGNYTVRAITPASGTQ